MIFNFTWVQAMALGCGVNCVVQDSLEKQTQDMDMAGHECCHGNKIKRVKTRLSAQTVWTALAGYAFMRLLQMS